MAKPPDEIYTQKAYLDSRERQIKKILYSRQGLTFIDLFAGVGGFHAALTSAYNTLANKRGGERENSAHCLFASEIDLNAQKTYALNFPTTPLLGDITSKQTQSQIPRDFTLLCGGFPCQAFSIAGYQKGFADTRGTLFFEIEKITRTHRPKVLFLENVKNLKTHNNGRTYATIEKALQNLNYAVFNAVLNSATHANIPQNRERIFIVAFDKAQVPKCAKFTFPKPIKLTKTIHDCLEKDKVDDMFYYTPKSRYYAWLAREIIKKDTIYQLRRVYVRENKSNLCPTLTANMGMGGHNVPLILDDYGIRKLTPRECFNFQGYPREFKLPNIANSALYKQAGNSITLPLVARIATQIFKVLL